MTRVLESLVELFGFGKSAVRDVAEGEDVPILASRVGVEVGDPSGSGSRLDIHAVLGGLGCESRLGHRKCGKPIHDLCEV